MDTIALISIVIAAIAAICSAISAQTSRKTALETRKMVLSQIIIDIRNQFNSLKLPKDVNLTKKMEKILSSLIEGHVDVSGQIEEDWHEWANKINLRIINGDIEAKLIFNWGRKYCDIFRIIIVLLNTKCINDKFVKEIIFLGEVELLLDVVQPLEKKNNLYYDSSMFDQLKIIFKEQLRG